MLLRISPSYARLDSAGDFALVFFMDDFRSPVESTSSSRIKRNVSWLRVLWGLLCPPLLVNTLDNFLVRSRNWVDMDDVGLGLFLPSRWWLPRSIHDEEELDIDGVGVITWSSCCWAIEMWACVSYDADQHTLGTRHDMVLLRHLSWHINPQSIIVDGLITWCVNME